MKKPKIRFKGYQEDWEQRKFADVVDIGSGMDYKHLEEGNIPVYGTGGYLLSVNKALSDDKDAIGIGRKGTIDKPYILRAPFWTVDTLFYCIPKENYDLDFTSCIFQNVDWKKKDESTGVPSLSKVIINNVETATPTMDEQQKIGEYFSNLDHLITLHQRKCEETKTLKKYMLQKMFPQNGHSVPEIRFSGFTEDWEQRKFGEIVQKYEDPVETPAEGYMRLGIRSHAKGTFHSYVEKGKELETAKMFRVAANNFIVNITFGWEHAVAITDESDAGKLVSHRFPQYSFKEGMNPRFFKYLILDECFRHHLELSSPGGAGRNRVLKLNEMLEYKMKFPQMEEQEEIAIYFEQLDNLITLHHRKYMKYADLSVFDWEQRKLSELSEKTFGGGTPKTSNESFWKGNIPWIQSSDLIEGSLFDIEPRKYISQEAVDKSATKLVPENSVAIVTRVGVGKLAFMPFSYATSQDFLSLSVLKTEPQFTVYALYKKLQSELNAVQGTSIKGVTKNELLAKEIMIPCYEEQEKIGSYLHSLDHLITLHQHKCEELQNIKKFMLKNMFI